MHKKWMAEINGAGIAGRKHLATVRRFCKAVGGELTQ